MTLVQLIRRSLVYHWRSNLAVLVGVIAGTAVIGGALVVGDSVKYSLQKMHVDRLGDVEHVVTGERFFREKLSGELAAVISDDPSVVAPVLVVTGGLEFAASSDEPDNVLRVGRVTIYGVDKRFWDLTRHGGVSPPEPGKIILGEGTVEALTGRRRTLKSGDEVTAWVEIPSSIPRDNLLGERDEDSKYIPFEVQEVLGESTGEAHRGVGRFGLNPIQQMPLVAFVSLATLQQELGLDEQHVRNPQEKRIDVVPAQVNSLFVGRPGRYRSSFVSDDNSSQLTELLKNCITLADLGLTLRTNRVRGYLSLESEQMVIEQTLEINAIEQAVSVGSSHSPVMVYLANEMINAEDRSAYSMYSIVAGVDPAKLAQPFGPFELAGEAAVRDPFATLGEDQLILNEWLARDLQVGVGDRVRLKYHEVGGHGELPEKEVLLPVHAVVRLAGPADDRGLTPHVPGITDADSFGSWQATFPMKLDRLTDRDDEYWDRSRATPKAFVTLNTAQRLWASRYGRLTSLRLAAAGELTLEETGERFAASFTSSLALDRLGLAFRPVRHEGLQAAGGTTPFSGLFIGFSFFLILSATILVGLLFRLGIERRANSIGLLQSLGMPRRKVLGVFLAEGLLVVTAGGVLGLLAAVGYAAVMVHGLSTWWVGAVGTSFLELSISPVSLLAGFGGSVVVAGVSAWWSARGLFGQSARGLLAGQLRDALADDRRRTGIGRLTKGSAALAGLCLVAGLLLPDSVLSAEAGGGLSWRIMVFFLVGFAGLVASVSLLADHLATGGGLAVRGAGPAGLLRLGLRNAARYRQRSVLSTALIASAAFVITAVAAGRREPINEVPDRETGNGGFLLVAESSQPILYDPGTVDGRGKLEITGDKLLLSNIDVHSFRVKPGEESSCLNLYQTRLPTVLGVPASMIGRGGFKFTGIREEHPWKLLEEKLEPEELEDGRTIPVYPVFGDMNTLQYSLKKGVGDRIPVPAEAAPRLKLEIVGMLDASVFQGVLLMSEPHFLEAYPERAGYGYFLVGDKRFGGERGKGKEIDPAAAARVTDAQLKLLESKLRHYGFDAEPVSVRLARFLAVQNTYLSTFQALGGLGLLLGTIGLATVMLRNVLERRRELALLRAIGFRRGDLRLLVLGENAFLLAWGIVSGAAAAMLAMAPHLATAGADVGGLLFALDPGRLQFGLVPILAAVFVVGMLAAVLAVAEAVRTPVVATLRSE